MTDSATNSRSRAGPAGNAEAGVGRAEATKRKLILAAEKLLGQRGFANVSQRMVQKEAGQRNAAVVTYHYKSFDDLLLDVFSLRMGAINERRMALYQALNEAGALDIRGIARVLIEPLARELLPRPEGNYYVRFLLQYFTDQGFRRLKLPLELIQGVSLARRRYRELRADLPGPECGERMSLCLGMIFHALAMTEMDLELEQPDAAARQRLIDDKTRRLVDATVAVLAQ